MEWRQLRRTRNGVQFPGDPVVVLGEERLMIHCAACVGRRDRLLEPSAERLGVGGSVQPPRCMAALILRFWAEKAWDERAALDTVRFKKI